MNLPLVFPFVFGPPPKPTVAVLPVTVPFTTVGPTGAVLPVIIPVILP